MEEKIFRLMKLFVVLTCLTCITQKTMKVEVSPAMGVYQLNKANVTLTEQQFSDWLKLQKEEEAVSQLYVDHWMSNANPQ